MHTTVIGTGYVGLAAPVRLAKASGEPCGGARPAGARAVEARGAC